MKKLICAFLLLSILCSFAACNGGEKVTIYVPDKITEYGGNTFTTYLLYEKNWQKKESFTVSYSEGDTTITYADRHTMTRGNGTQVDEYMDESGNVVSRVVFHETSSQLIQSVLTYDEHGRILTQTTSTSFSGGKDTYLPQVTFTYEETEQGSKGVGEQSGYVETYFYDKAYRMIGYSVTIMGVESSRTEYSYDKHGNRTEIAVYANGTLDTRSVITYKPIEVSLEMSDRLPQFKREN